MKFLYYILTALILFSCGKKDENKTTSENSLLKETIVSYMSQSEFTSKDFTQQVTGTNAELEVYDMQEKMLYFSVSKNDFQRDSLLDRLTEDPSKVEFGAEDNGRVKLGQYILNGLNKFFFRFPKNDIKVDTTRTINIKVGQFNYTMSIKELMNFGTNVTIYGGQRDTTADGSIYTANHGAFVSKKDEPSIKRLADEILIGETSKESKAKKLLEFVNTNIAYSNFEGTGEYEILKRPNEVIMTGRSDCSGLTILYASLLEQAGIDYVLLYFPGHISPAVEGTYPNNNGLTVSYEGKTYTLAETTVKGFDIGNTRIMESINPKNITFIQKPGDGKGMVKFK